MRKRGMSLRKPAHALRLEWRSQAREQNLDMHAGGRRRARGADRSNRVGHLLFQTRQVIGCRDLAVACSTCADSVSEMKTNEPPFFSHKQQVNSGYTTKRIHNVQLLTVEAHGSIVVFCNVKVRCPRTLSRCLLFRGS
jgi:hypothetical protein